MPATEAPRRRKRVVLVDDSESWCALWGRFLVERFGPERISVECYYHPLEAMPKLDASIDLLLVDLEMPMIDGRKFLDFAVGRGVDRRRIIVASGRNAEHLHEVFHSGDCLAVINKTDPNQQSAFQMILDSLVLKH